MRAIWKGAVSFGLVSVPVKLYAATESHDVSFRQVHAKDGGRIKERPVKPGDLAATIYRHFGVPPDSTYRDATDRQHNLLPHGGEPIRELF